MKKQKITEIIKEIYHRLIDEYGLSGWWEGKNSIEILAGVLLSQDSTHIDAVKAVAKLKEASLLDLHLWRTLDSEQINSVVKQEETPSGSVVLLRDIAEFMGIYEDSFVLLRAQGQTLVRKMLLSIRGLQKTTADAILLYVLEIPVFVIDDHTQIFLQRFGLLDEQATYEHSAAIFTENLPRLCDFYGEYHALINCHTQKICTNTPQCQHCFFNDICAYVLPLDK